MKVKSNLVSQIKQKGISCTPTQYKRICTRVSYYQLINAYKPIFAMGAQSVDMSIPANLNKYKNKYKSKTKEEISQMNIIEHRYVPNASIEDFYHYYQLENELSSVFLKYTLKIEECIKAVLLDYLNTNIDDSNYLLNLSNYKQRRGSLNTIKKIISKVGYEGQEKPLNKKHEQEITPPFWIIIKYLTFGETIKLIQALKCETEIINHIKEHFNVLATNNNIMYDIINVKNIRNHVAHNNALFLYNLDFEYGLERVKKIRTFPKSRQNGSQTQEQINLHKVSELKSYYNLNIDPNIYKEQDVSYSMLLTLIFLDVNDRNAFLKSVKNILVDYKIHNSNTRAVHIVDTELNNDLLDKILNDLNTIKVKSENENYRYFTEIENIERMVKSQKSKVSVEEALYKKRASYIDYSGLSESKLTDLVNSFSN